MRGLRSASRPFVTFVIAVIFILPAATGQAAAPPPIRVTAQVGDSVTVFAGYKADLRLLPDSIKLEPPGVVEVRRRTLVPFGGEFETMALECVKEGTVTVTFEIWPAGGSPQLQTYVITCRGTTPSRTARVGSEGLRVSTGPGTTVVKAASRVPFISTMIENLPTDGGFTAACHDRGDGAVDVSFVLSLSGAPPLRLPNPNLELVTLSDGRVIGVPREKSAEVISYYRPQLVRCIPG